MKARLSALTPREREVLALLERGLTNAEISRELGISFPTAKAHVASILAKSGAPSREEAVAWFYAPTEADHEHRWMRWALAPMAALVVAGSAALGATWAFRGENESDRPDAITVPLEDLEAGMPVRVEVAGLGTSTHGTPLFLWVLLQRDGGVAAYLAWDPASGCVVDWRERFAVSEDQFGPLEDGVPLEPWMGAFRDPCSGSTFDRQGVVWFGPAARGLDGFEATVDGPEVRIDLRRIRRGWCNVPRDDCSRPDDVIFAEELGKPYIAGWGQQRFAR